MKNKDLARILNHPHDHYFKNTFGKTEIARDFLKSYLPKEIVNILDLNTLTNQKSEYIDKKLKSFFTDLLYQININGQEGFIYILYEHKSYHDEKTIFQLLKYLSMIWDEHYDSNKKTIPAIIPILIYHGEKELKIKTRLWDMIENVETLPLSLKNMLPNFEFKAYDYSPKGKEPIKGTALIQAILWMLKAIREKNKKAFKKGYNKFAEQIQIIGETYGMEKTIEMYVITLVYIFNTREDITQEELQEGGDTMATLAKQIFHKGERKKAIETAINLYKMGLTIDQIAQATDLDKETLKEILKDVER